MKKVKKLGKLAEYLHRTQLFAKLADKPAGQFDVLMYFLELPVIANWDVDEAVKATNKSIAGWGGSGVEVSFDAKEYVTRVYNEFNSCNELSSEGITLEKFNEDYFGFDIDFSTTSKYQELRH